MEKEVNLHDKGGGVDNRPDKEMVVDPDELVTRLGNRNGNVTQGAPSLDTERSMQLRQVSVNVPSIQKSTASKTSEAGNLEKESLDGASAAKSGRNDKATSQASAVVTKHPPSTATTTAKHTCRTLCARCEHGGHALNPPAGMSEREVEIKIKLERFFQGVVGINRSVTGELPKIIGVTDTNPLRGINQQLKEMAVGHVQMAYSIATSQGYVALQTWLEQRFIIGGGSGIAARYNGGPAASSKTGR
jgi:hypothetical protein